MNEQNTSKSAGYRIGAVAKLTGISSASLRIWERRYQAVVPERTPSGDRLYSAEDVSRLRLMKTLVDMGDSISAVASLDLTALQDRAEENRPANMGTSTVPCHAVVIGTSLAYELEAARQELHQLTLVKSFANLDSFTKHKDPIQADVIIIEQPTLHADTVSRISDWINQISARHVILVYRFAPEHVLKRLPASKCVALRAPIDPFTIQTYCISSLASGHVRDNQKTDYMEIPGETVPPRHYDDATLAKISNIPTAVECECPHHLSELIIGLSAFESYSAECESRNDEDAALHAYLHDSTSRARHIIETALDRLIEVENIKL